MHITLERKVYRHSVKNLFCVRELRPCVPSDLSNLKSISFVTLINNRHTLKGLPHFLMAVTYYRTKQIYSLPETEYKTSKKGYSRDGPTI